MNSELDWVQLAPAYDKNRVRGGPSLERGRRDEYEFDKGKILAERQRQLPRLPGTRR